MNKDSAAQKTKLEPIPEAAGSIILGIVGLLAVIVIIAMIVMRIDIPSYGRDIWGVDNNIILVSLRWGWLFSAIGLTLGILGMKSSVKRLAICGIILSAVTLLINLLVAIGVREVFPFMLIHYPLF